MLTDVFLTDQAEAVHQFKRLIKALNQVGLETAVRPATTGSLFVFVKAREDNLSKAIYRGRYVSPLVHISLTHTEH